MSIDARIAGVSVGPNGVFLNLEARDKQHGPGQSRLEVLNPPEPATVLGVLVGECIWGGSSSIVLGDVEFAKRHGYCRIELLPKKLNEAAEDLLSPTLAEQITKATWPDSRQKILDAMKE